MKESAYSDDTKQQYLVTLEGSEEYITWATSERAAISNAAYRHAEYLGESVALVKWKINNDKISCEVEEL